MANKIIYNPLPICSPRIKLPPNRIYAAFYRSGKGLKEIGVYGADGKKLYEIHTIDHHGLGAHYHNWLGGKPVNDDAHVLTNEMKGLINKIINFKK